MPCKSLLMSHTKLRIFIAVSIPPLPRLLEALGVLRQMGHAMRPVAPENLHLTLKFLGPVDMATCKLIQEQVSAVGSHAGSIELGIHGAGVFPHAHRPTTVWAGMRDDTGLAALTQIVSDLDTALEPLGFAPDTRPWRGHLTLARIKARPPAALHDWLAQYDDAPLGTFVARSLDVMRSELLPHRPQYSIMQSVALT